MPTSILITGGAGFIGVNAAVHFVKKGHAVTILDNLSRKGTDINLHYLKEHHPEVAFIIADIRTDFDKLRTLVEKCDTVIHLAAQVAVTTSVTNPREDFDINALGTFNVLEAVRLSEKKPSLIFASTNKVYGGLEGVPVTEKDRRFWFEDASLQGVTEQEQLDFHSPYGCSKGAADQYVRDYSRPAFMASISWEWKTKDGWHGSSSRLSLRKKSPSTATANKCVTFCMWMIS
jgi:CDP-paratose 2-epimerase